jgi:hypothetical protein
MINLISQEKKLKWTKHAEEKMRFYGLSESRIKRVLRHPMRVEEGIAPETTAVMQRAGSKKHPYEIWVMYQEKLKTQNSKRKIKEEFFLNNNQQVVIISAWRYPGITKPGRPVPVPEGVWEEIGSMNKELGIMKYE